MALKIRLARGGAKKNPHYSLVVADSRSPRDGRFIEKIGYYAPRLAQDDPKRQNINVDRAKHWLSVGATPSERVQYLLSTVGLAEKPAVVASPKKSEPKAKAKERAKERAAKDAARAAAAEAAAAG